MNKALIIGNLTRDVELRVTTSGKSVVSFSVATNYKWKDANGQVQEKPEFHNVVAWGGLADVCGKYLNKGSKVYIEGRLQTREWEKDGVKRYQTEIIADSMEMLGGNKEKSDYSKEVEVQQEEEINVENIPF